MSSVPPADPFSPPITHQDNTWGMAEKGLDLDLCFLLPLPHDREKCVPQKVSARCRTGPLMGVSAMAQPLPASLWWDAGAAITTSGLHGTEGRNEHLWGDAACLQARLINPDF